MEIRLNCFNSVELNGFQKLKSIKLEIVSYNLNNNVLSGDVKTTGEYFKINDEKSKGFEDIVPFEIVFRDNKIQIEKVFIDNEIITFKETVGIKLQYEIVVEYSLLDEESEIENEEEIIEVPVETEEEYAVINEVSSDVEFDTKEEYIKEITKQFDSKIDEAMKNRNSIILPFKDNNSVSFKNQNCTYKTISVYYLKHENEIEIISKEKRIPINKLYEQNNDFNKTHRLIINE